jgi:hypothetical protein
MRNIRKSKSHNAASTTEQQKAISTEEKLDVVKVDGKR